MKTKSMSAGTTGRVALAVTGLAPFARLDASGLSFKKEVLRVGRWIHPATGEALDFDVALLERLAQDTNRWIALGQKVHFPAGPDCHDEDARDALANLGYWSSFRVEGERLVADVEVLDEAALPKIGKTIQDVSPEIRWPARSATGEVLEAAIFHVAATPIPAIPGQSNFERLSQLAREVSMAGETKTAPEGAPNQDPAASKGPEMLLAWARQALGLPADAAEPTVVEALKQRIDAAATAPTKIIPAPATAPMPEPDHTATLARLTREVKELRDESQATRKLAAELRDGHASDKRRRDEETVQLARRASADAGLPIPEDACRLALSLFAKNEDQGARELLLAYTARANDRRIGLSQTFASPPTPDDQRRALASDAAEAALLEDEGFDVEKEPSGALKREANGRPKKTRRPERR
jgi:hypothetical protein